VKQIQADRPGYAGEPLALLIIDHPACLVRIDGHSMTPTTSLAKQAGAGACGIHVDADAYLVDAAIEKIGADD